MNLARSILVSALCATVFVMAESSFGQGFAYNNIGGNGGARAPIYGPELLNPSEQRWGNTPAASPPGAQSYSGSPLVGTNFNVQAWYSLTPVANTFALIEGAAPVAGSLTYFPAALPPGSFIRGEQNIPDALPSPPGSPYPFAAYLQIRAWDNRNGLYPSWDEAWAAAQAGNGNAVGWSKTFEQQLAIGLVPYPGMENFESFNVFVVTIPEPSLTALALLGGAILFAGARISPRKLPR
jgi:hypothetical protein